MSPPSSWPMFDSAAAFVPWTRRFRDQQAADRQQEEAAFAEASADSGEFRLFEQQAFCRSYLAHEGPYRGLLMYHGLGSGKSCSAIATCEALRSVSAGVHVFVMLPASLRRNFLQEVRLCGGRMYREGQAWARSEDGRAWEPSPSGTPFAKLSSGERDEIREQIDSLTERTHHFINYNGLTHATLQAYEGMFDDSVVVVDEAHNFISNLDDTKVKGRLYDLLQRARRCKVMLLTGTPLVNRPVELAHAMNLAHGSIEVFEITLGSSGRLSEMAELIQSDARVHRVSRTPHKPACLTVRLLPPGFAKAAPPPEGSSGGVWVQRTQATGAPGGREEEEAGAGADDRSYVAGLASAASASGGGGGGGGRIEVRRVLADLLPSDPEEFESAFLSPTDGELVNRDLLAERCTGLISYFAGHDESLYPALEPLRKVEAPMSARQARLYALCRAEEHAAERRALRRLGARRGRDGIQSGAFMRTLSRAMCTFVFPDGIERPRASLTGAEEYDARLEEVLESISALPDERLVEMLPDLSPKFQAVIERLGSLREGRGSAIVYSQFRRVEGIGLLSVFLEAHGFVELQVAATPTRVQLCRRGRPLGEAEAREAVRQGAPRYVRYETGLDASVRLLFNNRAGDAPEDISRSLRALGLPETNLRGELVLALLITKSGAEGISTRNVREVHLLEPFWHQIRIDQVIGRARRAHSHDDLPPEERTVTPYLYLATMSDEQALAMPPSDQATRETSDQFVYSAAERKHVVLSKLLEVARSTAVDCERGCWVPKAGSGAYSPYFSDDLRRKQRAAQDAQNALEPFESSAGVRYWRNVKTGKLYDYRIRQLTGRLVERGAQKV